MRLCVRGGSWLRKFANKKTGLAARALQHRGQLGLEQFSLSINWASSRSDDLLSIAFYEERVDVVPVLGDEAETPFRQDKRSPRALALFGSQRMASGSLALSAVHTHGREKEHAHRG